MSSRSKREYLEAIYQRYKMASRKDKAIIPITYQRQKSKSKIYPSARKLISLRLYENTIEKLRRIAERKGISYLELL